MPAGTPADALLLAPRINPHRVAPGSKLTPSQRAIVEEAISTGDLNAAIRHDRPAISRNRLYGIKYRIEQKMREILDNAGLSDQILVRKFLRPALQARETRFFAKDGEVTDQRTTVDWGHRLQALDMAFNLHGSYAPKQAQIDVTSGVSLADRIRQARTRLGAGREPDANPDKGQGK